MFHWCLNCKNYLSLCPQRSNQFLSSGYLLLDQIHYGQSNSAGHLACTLRSPQAFTAKWGDASSFNVQSHRNQWGISPTHYLTLMPCGIKIGVQKAVEQIFFSLKHKWSEIVFNLLLCWADNAWPQAKRLAYNHTICSSLCGCKDLGSASISSFSPVLKNKIASSFLQLWPLCKQWHLISKDVPVNTEGCDSFKCTVYLENQRCVLSYYVLRLGQSVFVKERCWCSSDSSLWTSVRGSFSHFPPTTVKLGSTSNLVPLRICLLFDFSAWKHSSFLSSSVEFIKYLCLQNFKCLATFSLKLTQSTKWHHLSLSWEPIFWFNPFNSLSSGPN